MAAAVAPGASGASAMEQITAMVDQLAERMKQQPDDAKGWTMLARSYTVLGRFSDALPAYRRAIELVPNNANLLADYADAIAATKGSVNNAESESLVERALRLEPNHQARPAGTAAYDRGDFAGAMAHWQKIVDQLPAESELAQKVQASIAEAREHAGGATALAQAKTAPERATAAASSAAPAGKVSGTVTLAPALRAQAGPDDTVFVFARPTGGRMPLAVRRAKVADLPLTFTLDDSMAMAPGMTISSVKQLTVSARISKSGNALPQPGDLAGESAAVAPGASGIAVEIGSVLAKP